MQYSTLVSTIEKAGTVARSFLSLAVQKHNLPDEIGLLRLVGSFSLLQERLCWCERMHRVVDLLVMVFACPALQY